MYGSQWNSCTVDGDYAMVDLSTGIILASTIAANSDYGIKKLIISCFTACPWSLTSTTVMDTCLVTIMVNFISVNGGSGPFNYDIGNGIQNTGLFSNLRKVITPYMFQYGCASSLQVNLSGPTPITASFSILMFLVLG